MYISIEILIYKNVFVCLTNSFLMNEVVVSAKKYYTILVHNLKTSKTGVFNVIKGVNSPPQARKKSLFHFFCIQLKGIPPLVGGGV